MLYLTECTKLSSTAAATTVHWWIGINFMLPLIIAFVVDSFNWDRYQTILVSYLPYIAGLFGLTVSTYKTRSRTILLCSLGLVSIAQGSHSPSFSAFTRDQLQGREPNTETVYSTWSYIAVCVGCFLGTTIMPILQGAWGWQTGFAIPTMILLSSAILFLCGTSMYTLVSKEMEPRSSIEDALLSSDGQNSSGKGRRKMLEMAKSMWRVFPIWTLLLVSAVVMQQPATLFIKQGIAMKRSIGSHFQIPPAALQGATTLTIITSSIIYRHVVAIIGRITRREHNITVMQRMGLGMFITVATMVTAALVESKRLQSSSVMEFLGSQPLSIFWLLPQYVMLGLADTFLVAGMQEFFYSEFPTEMRTLASGVYTSVFGVGSYLSAILINAVGKISSSRGENWFDDDISKARLDKYYWLLAALGSLSLVCYVIMSKFYTRWRELDNGNSEN